MQDEKLKAPRYHYDGWRMLDEGKTVEIFVTTPDNQLGKIVLPWEEIDRIRKFGWERQEEAAKEVMKGKRVHCHHLKSWQALFPACCQIGKDAGPQVQTVSHASISTGILRSMILTKNMGRSI